MSALIDKVALVTGGGRGLGAAICSVLGQAGMCIAVADVRSELAAQVAKDLQRQDVRSIAVTLDVSDEDQAAMAIQAVRDRFDRLDVLVNNAGVDVTLPVEELSFGDWDRIMAVNVRGPFVMAKLALGIMREQQRGHIVNVVSTAAKRAWANASAYHASKWGLLGFSHALHVECRPHGIKVTAIVSGAMRTPFLLDRFPEINPGVLQDPRTVAETIRFILTQPDETVIPELMVLPMRETSWP